jgi:small subunit ribosomal protein S9
MVKTQAKKQSKSKGNVPLAHGVGRRKTSVARAWLRSGKGDVTVNGRDYKQYFDTEVARLEAYQSMKVVPKGVHYDVQINVCGGGLQSQAGAVKLAIARAFVEQNVELKPVLRENGLLTVDSRIKERKKYGQRGARRKFQFVKR